MDTYMIQEYLHNYMKIIYLRQSFGQNSIFFNNAQNELKFDSKHCFCDLNIKMAPFQILTMRLLWKLEKMAAKIGLRRRIFRPQF